MTNAIEEKSYDGIIDRIDSNYFFVVTKGDGMFTISVFGDNREIPVTSVCLFTDCLDIINEMGVGDKMIVPESA